MQTNMQTDKQTSMQTNMKTNMQSNMQATMQTNKQTNHQTNMSTYSAAINASRACTQKKPRSETMTEAHHCHQIFDKRRHTINRLITLRMRRCKIMRPALRLRQARDHSTILLRTGYPARVKNRCTVSGSDRTERLGLVQRDRHSATAPRRLCLVRKRL